MGPIPTQKKMAKITVTEAVRCAPANSYIFVEPGFYTETDVIVIDKSVVLVGLSGEGNAVTVQMSSVSCVMVATSEHVVIQGIEFATTAAKPVIDIQQGDVVLEACTIDHGEEGVLLSHHGCSLVMTNCVVSNANKAGIVCGGAETVLLVDRSNIRDCQTGVHIYQDANPVISKTTIVQCGTGVVVTDNGRGCIVDSTLSLNKKPGILTNSGGNPVVVNTKIVDGNSNGLFARTNGRGVVVDCEIAKNLFPGIASCEEGRPYVVGTKVREGKNAGIFVYDNGSGLFVGCQLRENTMPGVEVRQTGNPILVDCDVSRGQSNGIYLHNKAGGVFVRTAVKENALPGMAIVNNADPLVYDCSLVAGKDYALYVNDHGRGLVVKSRIEGCSAQPLCLQDSHCVLQDCEVIDGKKINIEEWLEKIPPDLPLLEEDLPDFGAV